MHEFSGFLGLNMSSIFLRTLFFIFLLVKVSSDSSFVFDGFSGASLSLDGISSITPTGLLQLTNGTSNIMGHAFHRTPIRFVPSPLGKPFSFSTTFVFAIATPQSDISGHGIAFVMSRTTNFSSATASQYLGLFNRDNNGNESYITNHLVAVEIDTILNSEFHDIDYNHVGIDVDSLISNVSHTAGYYDGDNVTFRNLSLTSGEKLQIWVDYSSEDTMLNVTLSPVPMRKPDRPLLSTNVNISRVVSDSVYVGFSSATGPWLTSHYILGWSFRTNGVAEPLDYTKLPSLPRFKTEHKSKILATWLPLVSCFLLLLVVAAVSLTVRRRIKYAEIREDWEHEYGTHRFSYVELFRATKGFKDKMLLGIGGFGRVYRGVVPASKVEVAVKRVSHESRQGMKEFVAEIVSIGQLRHRNIVQLLGYCRRKGELLLVYDFMPNGSLDKFLYDGSKAGLDWAQRLRIIKGVASGLLYLHQDREQVVIHRDIKSSNILLDSEMNARIGDFGLARLYDHGTDIQTTHIVGTMGYLAPELAKTGKASPATDVFAFGALVLEVACGRRPVQPESQGNQLLLVDWVLDKWSRGSLIEVSDSSLREEYPMAEMEAVLKLGLLCSHPMPETRPSMRQVMQFLDGDTVLPELSPEQMGFSIMPLMQGEGLDNYIISFPSPVASLSSLSGGR